VIFNMRQNKTKGDARMRLVVGIFCSAVALTCTWVPANAQADFPNKPVRILVPFAPGGFVDVAARIVGQKLSEKWKQQVVVENRPGGNGFIAVTAAARSAADGYTLLMAHSGEFVVNPAVFASTIPYSLERDFQPITLVSEAPMVIAVKSDSPFNSLADLAAAARANPGTIGMSSPGTGSINHLAGEWVALSLGVKFLHVPYKGGAPAAVAISAGEVPFGIAAISSAMPQIKAGRAKVLAITTAKRTNVEKSWPTAQEAGAKEVDLSIWSGLFAPKTTPQGIVDRIYADLTEILQMADVKEKIAAGGGDVGGMKPSEFTAQIKREAEKLSAIVKAADVKPE
jgi:tripartite-type tricarboxylate transporter receptor subunit TctC